jgi:hypothetical protein
VKRAEAEKLLGGHATGTLTEAEQKILFTAALVHQDIFDALMDEEVLRELLADPEAKAKLLAALAPAAPKVIPFWRRPGILGTAASLMMATLAGLVYLRNPVKLPTPITQEVAKPAPVQASAPSPAALKKSPPVPPRTVLPTTKTTEPAPSPSQQTMAMPPPPAAAQAAVEVIASQAEPSLEALAKPKQAAALKREASARDRSASVAGGVPGGVIGGVVGGVVGGVAARPSSALAVEVAAEDRAGALPPPPQWLLEPGRDGVMQVTVMAPPKALLVLLKRSSDGVEMLRLQMQLGATGDLVPWRAEVRLPAGATLDLYRLNHPVLNPKALPEVGPMDGFRARIYPAEK